MLNWRLIGWATAAGAFVSAASWGVYERSSRSKVEEDREQAYNRLTSTMQSLVETQKGRDNFQGQLEKVRTEQEDLSRRFVENQLRHRSAEDTWLSEKGTLQSQIDRMETAKRLLEGNWEAERIALQKEQTRRAQVEAQLAAERDANLEAATRWNQERLTGDEVARKQAAELQRCADSIRALQGDLSAAQTEAQRYQASVQQLQGDLSKTLNERDAAAVASQQTGAALNVAVNDLHRREMDVAALQNSVGQMHRRLTGTLEEAQQLQRSNQNLTRQVQQLTVQNQQLTAQIQQLQAQIKALNDQLAAARTQTPPPSQPPPPPRPRVPHVAP